MPTYKENETEFVLSIHWAGTQYRATIPKLLIDRIKQTNTPLHGEFVLSRKVLKLLLLGTNTEKYKKD